VFILLIGIGNEYRSDDGVGLLVVRGIRNKPLLDVTIKEESGEGAALIDAWQGFQNVIIVDAVSSGANPGNIYRIKAEREHMPAKFFHYSTHAFSLAEAVELARVTGRLPVNLLVYGIEGKTFSAGTRISPVVQRAAKKVMEQILEDVQNEQRNS
jgi:hydrogenase maturation protease